MTTRLFGERVERREDDRLLVGVLTERTLASAAAEAARRVSA